MSFLPVEAQNDGTSNEPLSLTAIPRHAYECFNEACNCRENYHPDEDCLCRGCFDTSPNSSLSLANNNRRRKSPKQSSSSFPSHYYSYSDLGSVYSHQPHLKATLTSYPIKESFQAYLQRRPLSSVLRDKGEYGNAGGNILQSQQQPVTCVSYVPLVQSYYVSPTIYLANATADYCYYPGYYYYLNPSNQIYTPSCYYTVLSPTFATTTTKTTTKTTDPQIVSSTSAVEHLKPPSATATTTTTTPSRSAVSLSTTTSTAVVAMEGSEKSKKKIELEEGVEEDSSKLMSDLHKKRKHLRSTSQPVKKVEENVVISTSSISPPSSQPVKKVEENVVTSTSSISPPSSQPVKKVEENVVNSTFSISPPPSPLVPSGIPDGTKKVDENDVTLGSINTQSTTVPSEPRSSFDWPTVSSSAFYSLPENSVDDGALAYSSSSVIPPNTTVIKSSSPVSYTSSSYTPSYSQVVQPALVYSAPYVLPEGPYSYGTGWPQSYYGVDWPLGFVPYPPPTVRYLNICGYNYPQGGSFHLSARGKELLGVL